MADKPIVIMLTIYPLKNKERKVIISGATDGEMPIVHLSTFAQLHPSINQMWAELLRRGPQPVSLKATPAKANEPADDDDDSSETAPVTETPAKDTPAIEPQAQSQQPTDLPVIEGDQMVMAQTNDSAVVTDTDTPLLSSLDEASEASNG